MAEERILVAGGSRGLGRAAALYFAERGYLVDVAYLESHDAAASLEKVPGIKTHCCDLSSQPEVKKLCQKLRQTSTLPLAGAIVSCGREAYGLYDLAGVEQWRETLDQNLSSAFYLAQELRSELLANPGSCLIFTSSVWGQCGAAMESLYSTAKAALIGLGKSLAKELASGSVRVNIVAPGVMDTEMLNAFSEAERQALLEEIPLGRFGTGEDFAALCYYLIALDRYMTGQVLGLNGGFYI
ncbi:MAG: SDR family oxidoreductase [Eubacteriales bacterium]|nr:SDR family oxidoreductase [Eubacteriales bacterium]